MSAVAASVATRATLDELVAEVLAIVREEGEPIRIAVPRVLDVMVPDDDAALELIRVGLQSVVNGRINSGWMPDDEKADADDGSEPLRGRPVTGIPRKNRIEIGLALLASRNYEGADGRRKSPMDFTLADCLHLAEIAESRSRGYGMLAKFAKTGAAFLRTTKAARIGDLPEDDLKKIGLYLAVAPEDK